MTGSDLPPQPSGRRREELQHTGAASPARSAATAAQTVWTFDPTANLGHKVLYCLTVTTGVVTRPTCPWRSVHQLIQDRYQLMGGIHDRPGGIARREKRLRRARSVRGALWPGPGFRRTWAPHRPSSRRERRKHGSRPLHRPRPGSGWKHHGPVRAAARRSARKSLWVQHWYPATTAVVGLRDHKSRGVFARAARARSARRRPVLEVRLALVDAAADRPRRSPSAGEQSTEVRKVYDVTADPDGKRLYLAQHDPMIKGPHQRYGYVLAYSRAEAGHAAAPPASLGTGESPVRIRTLAGGDFLLTADHETTA